MWGHMQEWGGSGWAWFAVGHVLWWLLIAVGIVVLLRWTLGVGRHRPRDADHAVDVLRERYARGEITQAEFEERKRVLGG